MQNCQNDSLKIVYDDDSTELPLTSRSSVTSCESECSVWEEPVQKPKDGLVQKILKTLEKTSKTDKYVRLVCSVLKTLRTNSKAASEKYGKLYSQLLVLRQVIRWNGLYETIQEWNQKGMDVFTKKHIFTLLFSVFSLFGDILDRILFVLDIFKNKEWDQFQQKVSQLESDCYFIECVVQLGLNTVAAWKAKGWDKDRKVKLAKVGKYILDLMTSYSKFSYRKWQLNPKVAGYMGLTSSILGLYTILA